MYKYNLKPKKGDISRIIAYKHDGSIHRIWHKNTILEATNKTLILANNKTSVTESNSRTWITKEMALVFFDTDCWFNIVCMVREDGIHYYCNLSSPFVSDIDGIKYIDYDLDIKIYPSGKHHLLDVGEYNINKKIYNYGSELDTIIRYNLEKLQYWIDNEIGPFSANFIEKWLQEYENIIKQEKLC